MFKSQELYWSTCVSWCDFRWTDTPMQLHILWQAKTEFNMAAHITINHHHSDGEKKVSASLWLTVCVCVCVYILTAALASVILAFFSLVLAASKSKRLTCSNFLSFCTQNIIDPCQFTVSFLEAEIIFTCSRWLVRSEFLLALVNSCKPHVSGNRTTRSW